MIELPPPSTAPAGWYEDPDGSGPRYFDGREWSATGVRFAARDEHPDLPVSVAVGALAVLVVSLLVSKFVLDVLVDRDLPLIALIAIAGTIGYGPSIAWGFYARRRWSVGRTDAGGWRFRWSDLAWGPLIWISALLMQLAMVAIVLALDIPLASNVDGVAEFDSDRAYIIATLVTAVIAAPLVEEFVFRGLVMRGFLRVMGPTVAIALQGVLFGVAHVDPVRGWGNLGLAIVLSGVGVAFGAAAYLLRRLGPTIVAHAIFNGFVLTLVLTGVAG